MRGGEARPEHGAAERRLAPLDGVRAVAIFVVMAYHSGIPGLRVGGFYGQDAFFVMSGLLITTLLLREGTTRRGLDLVGFWGRRARRLLPALVVLLLALDVYVSHVAPAGRYPGFRGDALSALFYVSNWHLIAASSDYFAATGSPSLLTHTWSLAIEEQYYLLWPLVVLAVLRWQRDHARRGVVVLLAVAAVGTVASALWMAHLHATGSSPSRLYYGTDTHAQCLLLGATLAAALWLWAHRTGQTTFLPVASSTLLRTAFSIGGLAGAGTLVWLWTQVPSTSSFAYEGGFLTVAAATAAVLTSVSCVPRGPLARLLGLRPVAFLGVISYGMYLWYFPTFAVITGAGTGLRSLPLFGVRFAAVVVIATVSYYLVERPLRTGRLLRIDERTRAGRARPLGVAVAAFVVTTLLVTSTTVSGASAAPAAGVVPPAPQPVATPPHARPPVKILLIGDSTGLTLGFGLAGREVDSAYRITVENKAILGCGVVLSESVLEHGQPADVPAACDPRTPPAAQWSGLLRQELAQTHPDLVLVVAGRWEMDDRRATPGGAWQNITQPGDAAYVRQQLELAVAISRADGARVALATAPCFDSGEQPDGSPWPEDSAARLAVYNSLVDGVAASDPTAVSVVPLDQIVCPAGGFETRLDGVTVRAPDGVHYPFFTIAHPASADPDTLAQVTAFGQWIAPRVLPGLLAAVTPRKQTESG